MAFLSTILWELISCYWFLYGITLLRTKLHVFWIFNETFCWFKVVRFGSPVCKNCTNMFPDNKIATQKYLSEVWITCVDIREDVISISIKLHCSGAILPNAWFRSCLLCKHAVGVDRLYLPMAFVGRIELIVRVIFVMHGNGGINRKISCKMRNFSKST